MLFVSGVVCLFVCLVFVVVVVVAAAAAVVVVVVVVVGPRFSCRCLSFSLVVSVCCVLLACFFHVYDGCAFFCSACLFCLLVCCFFHVYDGCV